MPVEAEWQGRFRVRATVGDTGHELIGDEPEALAGENAGPNPFALLMASLANCTVVTVVGEAELQGLALRGVRVRVRHKQNLICDGPADARQRELEITELRRTVTVDGDLTEEECKRLRWAAESCPVSRTLARGVPIITDLVRSDEA